MMRARQSRVAGAMSTAYDEGPTAAALPSQEQGKADATESAALRLVKHQCVGADDKRITTCKARAAIWSIILHVFDGDDGRPEYVFTQGPMTKAVHTLDEAEAWLARVGA